MSNKGRQNKVSQEVANPTVSKAEAEMAKNSIDTAKQAKKIAHNDSETGPRTGQPLRFTLYPPPNG
ncbi:hypothetical protein RA955_07720 [Geobacillus proteiniphilus]|uniref:Uncharacterized protein n=1 Tax=Geobacillus proteiniphilus TaxID=860353 RepID=A0ABY9MIM7_9BACL|nr:MULTISPECIES: hypothetical protein [Geobacillus]OPX02606.1 hypothetical protein B1A75_12490 [Geobacillus sp. LEMMY01]WMJ17896.1 hypothetical protein RA955_07720 [Geobacillus proteiniphilus]